jgi:tRNA modification GTPase
VKEAPPDGETVIARLTPPGRGAIATLALRGPRAWDVVRELFCPHSGPGDPLPAAPEPGRFWLGRLGEGRAGTPQGVAADEVVVALKRTTSVPWVELHCHGGPEVVRWLLEIFQTRGCRVCSWQEFERLTAADPLRAIAAAALAEAPTDRTAAILLEQYQGAFSQAVATALANLGENERVEASRILEGLARYSPLGRHLTAPWRVAVIGAPNVGKSSLVNALAGYQRSIVAATPGTTRDVVTTRIAVDGWPVELADTAGLREGAGDLEGQGIDRARTAAAAADLCLWVLDAAAEPQWPAVASPSVQLVVNKVDLPAAWHVSRASGAVHLSARTGAGLADLCRHLAQWLVPDPPPPGAAVPFTGPLCTAVEEALRLCRTGRLGEAFRVLEAVAGSTA